MIPRGVTVQQLDPAGTLGAHLLTVVLAMVAFVWALGFSVIEVARGAEPVAAALAVLLLGLACALVVAASRPSAGGFSALSHLAIHVLALGGFAFSTWSSWAVDDFDHDQWVPLGLGVIMVALAPYRPVREVVFAGTASAVILGAVTYVHADLRESATPPSALAVAAIVGVLALGYGAAMYASRTVAALLRWHRRADIVAEALADESRAGIARSVQRDSVTVLGRDVVSFFGDVLRRNTLTQADAQRARGIALAMRSVMVADADRTWLDVVVQQPGRPGWAAIDVDDPELLATRMNAYQRTALRAHVVALGDDLRVTGRASISIASDGNRCVGSLSVSAQASDHTMRSRYAPIHAVMRVAFDSLSVQFHQPHLIVSFSYELS